MIRLPPSEGHASRASKKISKAICQPLNKGTGCSQPVVGSVGFGGSVGFDSAAATVRGMHPPVSLKLALELIPDGELSMQD